MDPGPACNALTIVLVDDEVLPAVLLREDHARDEDAGVADDHASRLEQQATAEVLHHAVNGTAVIVRLRRDLPRLNSTLIEAYVAWGRRPAKHLDR